jgi:glutathione S-transferase
VRNALFGLAAQITAYLARVSALPGVKAWIDHALAEKDFRDFEEPYRPVPSPDPV